jgi:cold shock CspA family protein
VTTTGVLIDGVAPTKTSTNPADDVTGVGVNQNLIIYFSENISKGTGNIEIRRTDNDAMVESITVAGTQVTVSTNSATIDPSVTFANGTGYYVLIPATAFSDAVGNYYAGISSKTVWNFFTVDTTPPSGYSVNIDQEYINNNNKTALSFTFAGAEVGTTYNYTLTSSGGGGPITGSGSITSANQQVTGVTTFGLNEGTLTLSVTLTDAALNTGAPATATVLKDTLMPNGYSVDIDQTYINDANKNNLSFHIYGAETGASYSYSVSSTGGGTPVTGGGFTSGSTESVIGVDVTGLGDGTLTASLTMTDVPGNQGLPVTDTVTKDTVAPTGSILINGGTTTTRDPLVTLTLSASDAGSGVSQIRFSNDGSAWSAWEAYAGSKAWTLSSGNGTKTVYAQYRDNALNASGSYSDTILLVARHGIIDFDGDGRMDVAVYHSASGLWFIEPSSGAADYYVGYGGPDYSPVPGNYDDDGKTDVAVYHQASGFWFIKPSSGAADYYVGYGGTGYVPVPGDYDGDGKTDVAAYHQALGLWFINKSSDGVSFNVTYGGSGYDPVLGDFDGDGKTDFAVYHQASGYWYIMISSSYGSYYVSYGGTGYVPVPGDYDGDGKTDIAVYHSASGLWFIKPSSGAADYNVGYGGAGYAPIPGNYDGDGKTNIAVYHSASGLWFIKPSSGAADYYVSYGGSGYVPVNMDYLHGYVY